MRVIFDSPKIPATKTLRDLCRGDLFVFENKHVYMKIDLKCCGLDVAYDKHGHDRIPVVNIRYGSIRLLPQNLKISKVLDAEAHLFEKEI